MRWDELPRSDNIEDRRADGGESSSGGFGLPIGGGLGVGTLVILGLLGWALGIDPRLLIGGAEMTGAGHGYHSPHRRSGQPGAPNDQTGQFVSAVLGSTETVWREIFPKEGRQYRPPT